MRHNNYLVYNEYNKKNLPDDQADKKTKRKGMAII